MPTYEVTSPDGQTFEVTAPEGASQKEVLAYAQANFDKFTKKDISLGEHVSDIGAGLVSGAGQLLQFPGQLAGLATGAIKDQDFATTGLQGIGKGMQEWAQEHKSAGLKQREAATQAKVQQAEKEGGQWGALKTQLAESLSDPAQLGSFLAEQVPASLPSILAALIPGVGPEAAAEVKSLQMAAQTATTAAAKKAAEEALGVAVKNASESAIARGAAASIGTAAVQQGTDVGTGAYKQIYDDLVAKGAKPEEAADQAINAARMAGLSGAAISVLANKLPGAQAMERALAGERGNAGRLAGAALGALKEIPGEMVEEGGGQLAQNVAARQFNPDQSLTEGVGRAGALAALGAGAMGATVGAVQGRAPSQVMPGPELQQEQEKPLMIGMSQPFTPTPLPDGSVALTKADLDAYEQEQFNKKYAAQPNLNTVTPAETPPLLGYSPLAGTPKIDSSGNVMLTEEQEFQNRYAPQKKRMTTEEWNAMSPEERDAAMVQAQLQEQERIKAAEEEAQGRRKKQTGYKASWTPEEREALGIAEEPKAAKTVKPAERLTHPDNIGAGNQLIDEGAQPFADRKQAMEAAKNQPAMKPIKLPENKGYVLTPKTQEEIDRDAATAKKRAVVNVGGKPGEPIGAGQLIAGEGGLSPDVMEDMNTGGNYQHGLAWMYRPNGMNLDQAAERLKEAGYLPQDATESDAAAAIKNNTLAPEGVEMNAQKRTEQEAMAAQREEERAALESPRVEEMGYRATPQEIAQDYLDQVKEIGIDPSDIQEQAFEDTKGMSEDAYHDRVSELSRQALGGQQMETLESVAPVEKNKNGAFAFTSATKAEVQMEKDLAGKSIFQAAQYLIDKAPNAFYKYVGKRILEKLNRMQSEGVVLNFKVANGNRRPAVLYAANGLNQMAFAKDGRPMSFNVMLNGAPVMENQNGYPSGMSYKTLMHELLHTCTQAEIKFLNYTDANHPAVREMIKLYNKVAEEYKAQRAAGTLPDFLVQFNKGHNNALSSVDEMLAWAMTDERMQKWMDNIKVGEKTLFNKIVELIRNVMGISKPYETALERLVRTTEQVIAIDSQTMADGVKKAGYSYGPKEGPKRAPKEQQSLFSRAAQSMMEEETKQLRLGKQEEQPTPTGAGIKSMDILSKLGRANQEADPTAMEKIGNVLKSARDNPKATAEAARQATTNWMDKFETWTFSSDAALNNRIVRGLKEMGKSSAEKLGMLLNASLSQTVHSDAVASLFLQKGGIRYNEELHKWEGVDKDSNFVKLSKQLDDLASKNGLTKQQAELVAHTAFEAKRLRSMVRFNEELSQKIDDIKREAAAKRATSPVAASALSEKAARMKQQFKYISDSQLAMIAPGMELFKIHPELNDVVKTWNDIRENAVDTLVQTGLWSKDDAEEMLSNADYVPFYREEQLEQNKGPKEFIRGLQVQAREHRLKGSDRPVNDIFDNQVRWVQYSINRAVRNRSALALADTAVEVGAAKKLTEEQRKGAPNVVRAWRNGKEEFFSMDDPMFVDAFTGLEAIVIPSWKWASNIANMLRQSVVMYPLFSVAQVPQDSFAAMFSSGLKPQFALRIPVLAVKEFVQTLRGASKTHEELKNVGAVGVRDFTSAMVRMDAEIYAGLKAPPGVLGKVKYALNHIAMSADNAVRQAVYEASMAQGLSRAEAMEKAFDVFNVRRKGSSKSLALAGQMIPFFSAYLAAQNVAYRTITGQGISPTQRQEAYKTLFATTASVMVLSLLYAMMNGDDDDYLKKPATQRDRLLMVPGTGGFSIPLRADLFTMPKIITEHMYLMMTDKGYEDGRKFRDSMNAALGSALLSPTVVPQAIKPLVEVGINYDFFQGRPLIGTYQQKLETERQFTDSTSEMAKILGSTGIASPIAIDHLIRGMFGSVGGLVLYATNPMLHSDPNSPRPSLSERDAIAALPGMSGFMTKSYESALKKDFYTLKEEVDKAANTMNDLKTRSPYEIEGFLAKEENLSRLGLQKSVNAIGEKLSNIRKAVTQITNSNMPADEKREQLKMLREAENEMLKGVDVKALRQLGKI